MPSQLRGSSPLKKLLDKNAIMIVELELLPYNLGTLLWSALIGSQASIRLKTGGRREVM